MATSDQQLVMQDLLTGQELRHSIDPPVSDFTNAASVDPAEVFSILTNWHNQGLVWSKIVNDNYAEDGVQYCWKINLNGYVTAQAQTPPEGGPETPPPLTLTAISPTTGPNTTTVTITATGTGFSPTSSIAMTNAAAVGPTTYVDDTQISADVDLPDTPQTTQVTVTDSATNETTDPQDFTVT